MQSSRAAAKTRGKGTAGKMKTARKSFKGAVLGLIITIMSVLVFAIIVKQFGLSDQAISAINQGIKVVSIFISAFAASKSAEEGRILAGILAGGIYVVLGYLTFSLIESRFGDPGLLLADLAMGVVIGMLTAMIFTKMFSASQTKSPVKRRI